jgi:hypothetical protein
MLPGFTVSDPGNGTNGNPVTGPFTGPLTIDEQQETFFTVDEDIEVEDVVCSTAAGAAPAQQHGLIVCVNNVQNRVHTYTSQSVLPANSFRRPARIRFFKGETVYFLSVQGSGAIEAVKWNLLFKKPGQAPRMAA